MKQLLLLPFLTMAVVSRAQTIPPFSDKNFPADSFIVKKEQRTLDAVTVEILQVKPKTRNAKFSCRTMLTVRSENTIINQLAQDCDGVGGCSGLFFPARQPSKNMIIVSKFGDYDGRLYIIDKKGKLQDFMGGTFYTSSDNKYLFTNYDSDLSGVSIVNLETNELIYTGELKQYISDWYFQNGQYFTVIVDDVKVKEETGLLVFDFATKTFTERRTKEKLNLNNKLSVYNDVEDAPDCSCGR